MTAAYGSVERDLCRLAADRVRDALQSVLQLADGLDQQFMIATSANMELMGATAAIFDVMHGATVPSDPFDVMQVTLDAVRGTTGDDRPTRSEDSSHA